MNISEVKVWTNGKWSVYEDKEEYIEWCDSVLSSLFLKAEIAVCSYSQGDQVISKAMYIMKKRDNSELWFNSDSTAELTQIIHPGLKFTLLIYDTESIGSLMLVGEMKIEKNEDIKKEVWKEEFNDWYIDGIQSKDYAVIHFQAMEYRVFNDGVQIKLEK